MSEDKLQKKQSKIKAKTVGVYSAKECAYLAAFVALVLALQLVFAAVPGVELVTVSFVAYAFAFGAKRGCIAATAFALIRQLVFGFFATVLILYLVYFNLLALLFGLLGKKLRVSGKNLVWLVLIACVCTVFFSMFDNVLTPLWYGYSARARKAYFLASLPFMIPQVICTAVSVSILFLPMVKVFSMAKRTLTAHFRPQKENFDEK